MKKFPNEFLNEIHSQNHIQKIENSKGKRGYFDSDTPFTENRGYQPTPQQILE